MYGKHFASMYEGSLYGSGAVVFAVWGYVIACQVPDREHGAVVTLNARKLADTLGEEVADVETAIEFLCRPDERSTTKDDEGRRLVKLGEFEYRVVNGAKYRAIRDEEERRRQSREAQRRLREKKSANPLKKRIFPPAGTPAAEAAAQKWAEIEAREPNELPVVPETGIPITGEEVGNCE